MYISADKNPARRATEQGTKRLLDVLLQALGDDIPLHAMKPEGVIFVDWIPMVKLQANVDASFSLEWSDELVARFGVSKTAIASALVAASTESGGGASLRARIAATPWRP